MFILSIRRKIYTPCASRSQEFINDTAGGKKKGMLYCYCFSTLL